LRISRHRIHRRGLLRLRWLLRLRINRLLRLRQRIDRSFRLGRDFRLRRRLNRIEGRRFLWLGRRLRRLFRGWFGRQFWLRARLSGLLRL
jgi:hypothetical protein